MPRYIFVVLLAAIIGGSRLSAVPQHMELMVEADRVLIGHEFVPRFARILPKSLVVPAGQTVVLPADSTWDAIEVAGTLAVSRSHDTTVRFTHLLILPGGMLDAGTPSSPILRRVEFIVRDVPLDLKRDPFQWGNGILNFGSQTRVGRALEKTWTELAADAPAGATSLTLTKVPAGWQVGDELVLPDTAQMGSPRRDPPTRITSIDGNTIALSQPLGFERLSIRDPEGRVILRPRVANLTRNIVVRSENPAGTRGHTANIGGAAWDVRYNQFTGMGRTTFEDLDNTSSDGQQIGKNQIAKYADHDHHGGSSLAVRRTIGNSYDGTGGSKWAKVVHATHDVLVEDNVCVDFQGGCFVTEDGYEVRNVFRRNFAAYSVGNGRRAGTNIDSRRGTNAPGGEGSGFWFRGQGNTIEGNESWNNVTGINLFNTSHVGTGSLVPSTPGGSPNTEYDRAVLNRNVPVSFKGNITAGNSSTGLEYWNLQPFPATDHVSANNGARQVWSVNSGSNNLYLVNPTLIAQGGRTDCTNTSAGYTTSVEIEGGLIAGCDNAIQRGGAFAYVYVKDTVMQNRRNVLFTAFPDESRFENVLHKPLGSFPPIFIQFGRGGVWEPGTPLGSTANALHWQVQRGSQHVIVNWQGTRKDYRIFANQQKASTAAWPALDGYDHYVPEEGLTMGQAWAKYGMAYKGEAIEDADAVELEGLEGGVVRPGLDVRLGTPRCVVTSPNRLSPATPSQSGTLRLELILTGDYKAANEVCVLVIDNQAPVRVTRKTGDDLDTRRHNTNATSAGPHEVRTWRENLSGQKIPASEMTFQYSVDTGPVKTSSEP